MTKKTSGFDLVLAERNDGTPKSRWLSEALREEIARGRLAAGTRLPATREMAAEYALSRGTVVNAFEQLKAEGYLEGSAGSGTFVSRTLPEELLEVRRPRSLKGQSAGRPPRSALLRLSSYGRRVELFRNFEIRPSRAFRANLPALELFPAALWAKVAAHRLRRVSMSLLLGCEPMGYRPLREAVAGYLGASRGVRCEPGQVAIVSGVQEALELVARLLLNPGDEACMESPGYPGAVSAFRAAGARVMPLSWKGGKLREAGLKGARLVYVTPGHQFPLGTAMSLAERLQLLDWSARSGAAILEDDYDSEFRYRGRPVPALQGLDRRGQVIYTGSFNKVLFPSLRLGYLVMPPELVERVEAAISIGNRHAPLLEQAVLADFVVEGHFGRHLRRMRQVYAERLGVLQESVAARLGGVLEITGIDAGLQTAAWLGRGLEGESAAAAAAKRGVEVTPLSRYCFRGTVREGLHLGFAAFEPKEIRAGVRELGVALEGLLRQ
jgi:GntR family transcriptional regulator/MocR family aminotransferase